MLNRSHIYFLRLLRTNLIQTPASTFSLRVALNNLHFYVLSYFNFFFLNSLRRWEKLIEHPPSIRTPLVF